MIVVDSLSYLEFGRRAWMRTIYINGGLNMKREGAERARGIADAECGSLAEAVDVVMKWSARTQMPSNDSGASATAESGSR